jgi:hypothetical protein
VSPDMRHCGWLSTSLRGSVLRRADPFRPTPARALDSGTIGAHFWLRISSGEPVRLRRLRRRVHPQLRQFSCNVRRAAEPEPMRCRSRVCVAPLQFTNGFRAGRGRPSVHLYRQRALRLLLTGEPLSKSVHAGKLQARWTLWTSRARRVSGRFLCFTPCAFDLHCLGSFVVGPLCRAISMMKARRAPTGSATTVGWREIRCDAIPGPPASPRRRRPATAWVIAMIGRSRRRSPTRVRSCRAPSAPPDDVSFIAECKTHSAGD